MHPAIELDLQTLAQNARAWRDLAAPAESIAVVKANGYGWGLRSIVPALEPVASAFCVSDADELRALRELTDKPAIVLSTAGLGEVQEVLTPGALPSIATGDELRVARAVALERSIPLQVRVGLRPAALWSGFWPDELRAFAPSLAAAGAAVNLWTHLTAPEQWSAQMAAFEQSEQMLREAGVRIAATDVLSTFPLARGLRAGTGVRVGVGLFGATGGAAVPGVRCALRMRAPVTRIEEVAAGTPLGYGGRNLAMDQRIVTARCGYADGLPQHLEGTDDILSVGMQYLTMRAPAQASSGEVVLLDEHTGLDAFAKAAGRLPHELITALGNSARATRIFTEV